MCIHRKRRCPRARKRADPIPPSIGPSGCSILGYVPPRRDGAHLASSWKSLCLVPPSSLQSIRCADPTLRSTLPEAKMPTCRSLLPPKQAASGARRARRRRSQTAAIARAAHGTWGTRADRLPTRRVRYGLGPVLAGADIAATWPCGGGTSKAEIGVASSSARSRPRVARQYLGESSRKRSRGQ
jgi:hypothetical protein